MGNLDEKDTRVNKFEKRRKNRKAITFMVFLATVLAIALIRILIFDGKDNNPVDQSTTSKLEEEKTNDEAEEDRLVVEDEQSDEVEQESDENNEIKIERVEPSEENVIEAYTGNWLPVMTEQSGAHTINYNKNSQDRIEMERAIRLATGLEENNMTTWWLENGGDNQTLATVSNNAESENYRVLIQWIDDQGWQPIKVEVLKKNDQKWRFE